MTSIVCSVTVIVCCLTLHLSVIVSGVNAAAAAAPTHSWCWDEASYTHTTILQPFFWDYPGEPVPEEIFFWTLFIANWCKGRYQR